MRPRFALERLVAFALELQRARTFEDLDAAAAGAVAETWPDAKTWLAFRAEEGRALGIVRGGRHTEDASLAESADLVADLCEHALEHSTRTGEPLALLDLADAGAPPVVASRLGIRTIACAPLRAKGEACGLFLVGLPQGEARPSDERLAGLVSLVSHLTAASVRVREETPERASMRALEEAARRSEAHRAAVMEAALDAIVLMDAEGRILDFNHAAELAFGYARSEVIGRKLGDTLVPLSLRAAHDRGLARYVATERPVVLGQRLELSAIRKDGTEFPVEVAVVRIRSDGPPVFTGYIRDITERRKAAEAQLLLRGKEAAEAANRELEALSYSVAHDLRTPLRGINGFSRAVLEDYDHQLDDAGKDLLGRVISSAVTMGHIIDGLLSLARIARIDLRRESVDLAALARAVVEKLARAEPERVVEFVCPARVPADGDPDLLALLLEHLIGNAWKFTQSRPRACVELGFETTPTGTRYFVRDDGAGFDMAFATRLFLPFQRLHSERSFDGQGLGLATAQRIVRRHMGQVSAEGRVDGGATFFFTLGY